MADGQLGMDLGRAETLLSQLTSAETTIKSTLTKTLADINSIHDGWWKGADAGKYMTAYADHVSKIIRDSENVFQFAKQDLINNRDEQVQASGGSVGSSPQRLGTGSV